MKRIIVFLSGFVGGALAGWYAGSKIERSKCDLEIESAKHTFERAMEDADRKVSEARNRAAKADDDRAVFADALTRLGYSDEKEHAERKIYQTVDDDHPRDDDNYHQSDPSVLEIPTEEDFRREEKLRNKPPEVIAETVFAEDFNDGYDQQDLLWYPEDRIMLDADNNEMIDDPYSFLGLEWENDIDVDSEYSIAGETYVRNYRWETDYFILKRPGLGSENMSLGD